MPSTIRLRDDASTTTTAAACDVNIFGRVFVHIVSGLRANALNCEVEKLGRGGGAPAAN